MMLVERGLHKAVEYGGRETVCYLPVFYLVFLKYIFLVQKRIKGYLSMTLFLIQEAMPCLFLLLSLA
jgi:hypothetical protein